MVAFYFGSLTDCFQYEEIGKEDKYDKKKNYRKGIKIYMTHKI